MIQSSKMYSPIVIFQAWLLSQCVAGMFQNTLHLYIIYIIINYIFLLLLKFPVYFNTLHRKVNIWSLKCCFWPSCYNHYLSWYLVLSDCFFLLSNFDLKSPWSGQGLAAHVLYKNPFWPLPRTHYSDTVQLGLLKKDS